MDIDNYCFSLNFSAETSLEFDEPDAYMLNYRVTVHSTPSEGVKKRKIGYFNVWRYNVSAYKDKDGNALFDLFDADSNESAELFNAIFDYDSDDFKPEMVDLAFGSDVLHFQWGHFPGDIQFSVITLAAVERIIDSIGGGCGVVALWPWDKPTPVLEEADSNEVIEFFGSQEQHEAHWGNIGFKRIDGTSILFRDMSFRGYSIRDILSGNYKRLGSDGAEDSKM